MRLFVGIPIFGDVAARTAGNYWALGVRLGSNPYIRPIELCTPHRTQMVKARIHIAQAAVEGGYTHILWLDDDMIVPPSAVDRLAIHEKAIIGGLCHKRLPPYAPIVMHRTTNDKGEEEDTWWWDHPEHGVHEVLGTGFGCLLTKTDIFRDMDKPWFEEKEGGAGSDLHFCKMARKAGHQIFVDFDLDIQHLGQREEVGRDRRKEWVRAHPESARDLSCFGREQAHHRAEHPTRPGVTYTIDPFA